MEFYVHLIRAPEAKQSATAMECLDKNCTHVVKDIYIFEGDLEYGLDVDGVQYSVIAEGYVPLLGGRSRKELFDICEDSFGIAVEELFT